MRLDPLLVWIISAHICSSQASLQPGSQATFKSGSEGNIKSGSEANFQPGREFCFQNGVTWDHGENNVAEFQINKESALSCQESCSGDPLCSNFTWYSASSPTFSRICVLYKHIPPSTYECQHCTSGPNTCPTSTTSTPTTTTTTVTITTTTTFTITTTTTSTTITCVPTTLTTSNKDPITITTTNPTTTTSTTLSTTSSAAPSTTTTTITPTITTTPEITTTKTISTITTTKTITTITTTKSAPTTTTLTTSTTTNTTTSATTSPNPDCNSDCRCTDFTYDDCHNPHPTTCLHVQDVQECIDNCQVFALENRCDFIIYRYTEEDENCLIMEDDIHNYLRGCTFKGQPLYQDGNELMQDCAACPDCESSCISCYESPCFGYAQLECDWTGQPHKGSDQDSYMDCLNFCKEGSGSTYAIYDGTQSKRCHCYSSGERHCRSLAMQLEADQCIDTQHLL